MARERAEHKTALDRERVERAAAQERAAEPARRLAELGRESGK